MTQTPRFIALNPTILDERRISLNIITANLPETRRSGACIVNFAEQPSNVALNLDLPASPPTAPTDTPPVAKTSTNANDDVPEESKFPTVELNIVDDENKLVVQSMVIAHQEPDVTLTLHIPNPQLGHTYIAYAEMLLDQESIHTISTPFVLEVEKVRAEG